MKTFLRMIAFVVIGYLVSFVIMNVIVVAVIQPTLADISKDAAQGKRAATLQVAIKSEKLSSVINLTWSVALGTAYGLERGWRFWRRQTGKRSPGLVRWLGAAVAGLIAAITIESAYKLWLILSLPAEYLAQPGAYARQLTEFGQWFEASSTITVLVWLGATIWLGWLSGRHPTTQPNLLPDLQIGGKPKSDDSTREAQPAMEQSKTSMAAAQKMEPTSLAQTRQPIPSISAAEGENQSKPQAPPPTQPEQVEEASTPAVLSTPIEEGTICRTCGKNNQIGNRYCIACGASLVGVEGMIKETHPIDMEASPETEIIISMAPASQEVGSASRSPAHRFSGFRLAPWLFLVSAVLLLGLGAAIFGGYWLLGQREFTAGMAAYESTDCQTAMQHFNQVTGLYRWTFSPNVATAEAKLDECGLLIFAEDSRKQMNYANAVSGYETYLHQYPKTVFEPGVRNNLTEIYNQLASQLQKDHHYEVAIEKYQHLLKQYPDTPLGQQAATLLTELYDEWAVQLQTENQYAAAIEKRQIIQREYPDTPLGQQAAAPAAKLYAEWAARLRTEGQYEGAIEKYQIIQREYLNTPIGQQATTLVAEVYAEWATQLKTQGQYQAAIAKYQIVLDTYPQTPIGQQATALIAELYDGWATQLQQKGQYQATLEKYHILQQEYPDTRPGQQAATLALVTYGKWVDELRRNDDYEAALKTYETFTTLFPEQDASLFVAETYNAWGQHLRGQQKYLEAMTKFSQAPEVTSNTDAITTAKQGYQETLWELSQDTGTQGAQVIKETWDEVCRGQPATSPAISLVKVAEPGRAWFGGNEFGLSEHLQATSPGHFIYAVCMEAGLKEIERCQYIPLGTVVRQQPWWRVTIRDTRTAAIVHQNTFNGSQPPYCPFSETFSFSFTKYNTGDEPTGNEVNDWLLSMDYPLVRPGTPSLPVTPTPPAPTPTATPAEKPAEVLAPSAPEPTAIPLKSEVSIAQIGSREVTDVDINPHNPGEVYALVKGDGIYKSSTGGDGLWFRMNVDGSAITAFVIDPHNSATFYAPTWNGVLKSTDGGNTWEVKTGGLGIPNRAVDVITVHPSNPNIIYGGIGETLIVSTDGGESWSTRADEYGHGLGVSRFYQIVIDPFNHDIIYVGGAAGEIYKSVDAGRNFTRLGFNVGEGAFSLVAHPTQKDVYLAGLNSYNAGIIKTENGVDFRSVSKGLIFGGADSAYSAITYAPSNPVIVYAGSGYEDNRVAKGLFKSVNGGESWTSINNGLKINSTTGYPHYVKSMAVHPTKPDIVFAATGSGLYKSVDGGATWSLR